MLEKEYPNYLVTEELLAQRLVDAGLYWRIYKRLPNKREKGKMVWLFDKVPEVKTVMDQYFAEKELETV